jgi:hypothetical protein
VQPVKVVDSEGQVLFSCSIRDREKAFEYARSLESYGIEAQIQEPSLPETLLRTLGGTEGEQQALRKELEDEINGHQSCCLEEKNQQ